MALKTKTLQAAVLLHLTGDFWLRKPLAQWAITLQSWHRGDKRVLWIFDYSSFVCKRSQGEFCCKSYYSALRVGGWTGKKSWENKTVKGQINGFISPHLMKICVRLPSWQSQITSPDRHKKQRGKDLLLDHIGCLILPFIACKIIFKGLTAAKFPNVRKND